MFFWHESGFRADAVHGRTWGVKGETPVVERPGQRQSISAASAVNAKGAFWYCTYEGGLTAEQRLADKIEVQLAEIKKAPGLISSLFKAPSVDYIADC